MSLRKFIWLAASCTVVLSVIHACRQPEVLEESAYNEWLSGGTQTVFDGGVGAFSTMFPVLPPRFQEVHAVGDGAFGATFVSAPAPVRPGLGPIFNNVSCTSCHIGDGRGKAPDPGEPLSSLLIRLSVPGQDEHGGPVPAPGFGGQLQQRAIFGIQPEASVDISYTEQAFQFDDGTSYSLRTPVYSLVNPYIALPSNLMLSPRVAPPVFGLGLLEAIAEEDILAHADESDQDADGISGKPNYVWDVTHQKKVIGRFGWKANNPTLLQQSAGAYNQDMGISNSLFPYESSYGQSQGVSADEGYEVSDSILTAVAFYIRTLGVPVRRDAYNPQVLAGKQLFVSARCSACHTPRAKTKTDVAFPQLSSQTIFPYTDLLLHDMGSGLADNRPDFEANGQEWRTPPLWGIGLTNVVNGHNNFLHDGRARSLLEAVMWHGGEAEGSRQAVTRMSKQDRDALISFLESL